MVPLETKQRALAVLPIVLIGLGISGGLLIAGGACYEIPSWRLYSGIAFGGLIALFIGGVGIIGISRKMPDWSVVWIAISAIGFLVTINFLSSIGLPSFWEVAVLLCSAVIGLVVFYMLSKKSWQIAGLFGIGLSTALSLILFFMATNISHNEIKIGYFDLVIGLAMSVLLYYYLKATNSVKLWILFVFMIVNSSMLFIFDESMRKLNYQSALVHLLIFSNGLLFCGIVFHFMLRWINRLIKKK